MPLGTYKVGMADGRPSTGTQSPNPDTGWWLRGAFPVGKIQAGTGPRAEQAQVMENHQIGSDCGEATLRCEIRSTPPAPKSTLYEKRTSLQRSPSKG